VRIKFLEENLFGNVWGEPVVEAFRREYPQIELEIFDYSEPTHSTLTEAAKASDCFAWNSPPDPSEVMATLDLQPLIDADATFPRNDYWPAALQPFQQDGRLSGLPFTLSFPVLYYNQALFDEAGLPYPTSDWTLSDLLATAERLTDITGSTKQYGLLTAGSVDLALFLDQNQIALTTGSGATLLPQYTDPTVVSALEQFVDVMKKVTPFQGKTIFASPTEAMQVVDIQQGGMFFGSDPLSWIPSQVPDARFGVVMMRNIPPAPYIQPPGLFISAQTEHPEACWTWIKFLSNTD